MEQVGRYQIFEELGRGAHGVVYRALDPAIGREIAIKAISFPDVDSNDRERFRNAILREARLAGTLSHPNIITVYDVLDQGNEAFIIMEFVDGASLEEAITDAFRNPPGQLTRTAFISTIKQVAQALDYAHRKGVIHRDVKPANIVLTDGRIRSGAALEVETVAKIADFGVAKFSSHEITQQVSGQGRLIGTPSYMSPEQIQGETITGASDQFSLAVIAYEVLCGRKAFAADSIDALFYTIRHEREAPVTQVNPALSATLDRVMERALAKIPGERFASCSEFAGALEFALGDSPHWDPGVMSPPPVYMKRNVLVATQNLAKVEEEKSRRKQWALIGALAVAILLAIAWIVRMNSGQAIPTQVLDTRNGPIESPPGVQELKYDRHTTAPPTNTPTTVNVPVPRKPVKRAPELEPVRQAKQNPMRQAKPAIPASGDVQITSDPPGASVVIDGLNSCYTPCSVTLSRGRHTLVASMNGYATARRIFNYPSAGGLLLELVKSVGVLVVSSEPPRAAVNLDGQTVGTTPMTLRLPPGQHRVGVWDGARWHEQTVEINADEVSTRMFRF